jgi:hypothetical protein
VCLSRSPRAAGRGGSIGRVGCADRTRLTVDDDPDCLGQLLHLRVQDVAMLRHNVEHEGCPHA